MHRLVPTIGLLAAAVVLALTGCGSSPSPSPHASEKTAIRKVLPPVTARSPTGTTDEGRPPRANRSPPQRSRLLAGPLVLRYPGRHSGVGEPLDPAYVVFFRTTRSFIRRDDVGTTVPGELRVDDAEDDHDGYDGAIGDGITTGKCYQWQLSSPAPRLDRRSTGAAVRVTLTLPKASPRSRTATLQRYPPSEARLSDLLRGIGCSPRSR
jgi:hypothetical protein